MDFKKPVYEQVMKLFSPYLQGDADEGSCFAQKMKLIIEEHMESPPA